MKELLEQQYFNNTIEHYLIALGIILGSMLLLRLFRKRLLHQIKRWTENTETKLDDYFISGLEKFGLPMLNFAAIYVGLSFLNFTEKTDKLISHAFTVVIAFYVVRLVTSVIRLMLESFTLSLDGGQEKLKQVNGIMLIINLVIWSLGLLFLFDNFGYDVTAVIAGLGIGGIAIALAATVVGVRVLRFLPVSLADEQVDPHYSANEDAAKAAA